MKTMTFSQLLNKMEANGNNLASVAIGRMMIIIEEQTGVFPDWNDTAPDWVINKCMNRG